MTDEPLWLVSERRKPHQITEAVRLDIPAVRTIDAGSLPDAEPTEDASQKVVRGDTSGDLAKVVLRTAKVDGQELTTDAHVDGFFGFQEGGSGLGQGVHMARVRHHDVA